MIVDRSRALSGYFMAYLDAHGIKDGDEVKFPDYSHWIIGKHNAFRAKIGCPYWNGYPPEVQKEFNAFIRQERLDGGN